MIKYGDKFKLLGFYEGQVGTVIEMTHKTRPKARMSWEQVKYIEYDVRLPGGKIIKLADDQLGEIEYA